MICYRLKILTLKINLMKIICSCNGRLYLLDYFCLRKCIAILKDSAMHLKIGKVILLMWLNRWMLMSTLICCLIDLKMLLKELHKLKQYSIILVVSLLMKLYVKLVLTNTNARKHSLQLEFQLKIRNQSLKD